MQTANLTGAAGAARRRHAPHTSRVLPRFRAAPGPAPCAAIPRSG